MMKRNKYFVILVIGFVLWAIETAAFGFNAKPSSGFEGFLDTIAIIMMVYGMIGDITTNLRITKTYHSVNTNNIKTKNVEVTGDNQRIVYKQSFKVAEAPKIKE